MMPSRYLPFLSIFFIPASVQSQPYLLPGQCPLKIPSSAKTTTPTLLSSNRRPGLQVIAHRGSSFSLPEHTIPAYRLALELGADYIEPDLVSTKDGRLVAVHSVVLNITTNIEEVFPNPRNGGYYVYDFTLEEVKQLRVKQRLAQEGRSQQFNNLFPIPTVEEIFDLLYDWNSRIHPLQNVTKRSGVYAELKNPEIFLKHGINLVERFMSTLQAYPHANTMFFGGINDNEHEQHGGSEYDGRNSTNFGCEHLHQYSVPPLVVQCFSSATLQETFKTFRNNSLPPPPLVLLVSKKECHSPTFWYDTERLGRIVSGVGPDKECLFGANGKEFMIQAKEHELVVHPWTTRAEMTFVMPQFSTAEEELRYMYCRIGIDAIFTENVDLGVRVGTRGCDDLLSPKELLEEDEEYADEKGLNGTLSNKKCPANNDAGFLLLTGALIGGGLGMMGSLLLAKFKACELRRQWSGRGRQSVPSSSDDDHEII